MNRRIYKKKWEEETQKEIDEKNYLEDVLTTKLNEVKAILQKKEQQENYLQQKLETLYKKIEQTGEQQESLSRELEQTKNELQLKSERESILQKKVEDNEAELASFRNMQQPDIQPGEYLSQLSTAQSNLLEHNQRISRLLEQIELLKESEKKHLDTLQVNEGLQSQLRDFRQALSDKESEIKQIRQQQILIHELKERLGKAHEEYNTLRMSAIEGMKQKYLFRTERAQRREDERQFLRGLKNTFYFLLLASIVSLACQNRYSY